MTLLFLEAGEPATRNRISHRAMPGAAGRRAGTASHQAESIDRRRTRDAFGATTTEIGGRTMTTIADDEPIAIAVTDAIRAGDVAALTRLLEDDPSLATVRIVGGDCDDDQATDAGRTLLHIATDWPGNFPARGAKSASELG
jgi:hypothetical protein